METIVVNNVSRTYYDPGGNLFTALNRISMEWHRGESIAVIGESGSGKSTLARLLIGLERPSAGEILIDGCPTSNWTNHRWRLCRTSLQAVFQDEKGTLSPGRTVYQNAEEALCNLTSLSGKERRNTILSLMDHLHLDRKLLDIPVRMLSGGEQRRIGLLRALAVKPQFLVLDEVTAGLDLLSMEAVVQLLQDYQENHECGYLLITHDLDTASQLCSRLFEVDHGRIIHEAVRS